MKDDLVEVILFTLDNTSVNYEKIPITDDTSLLQVQVPVRDDGNLRSIVIIQTENWTQSKVSADDTSLFLYQNEEILTIPMDELFPGK